MRRFSQALTFSSLALSSVAAFATPIAAGTYNFTNTTAGSQSYAITGSVTLNSSGLATGASVTLHDTAVNPFPSFTNVVSKGMSGAEDFAFISGPNGQLALYYLPTLDTNGNITICVVNGACSNPVAYTQVYNPNFNGNVNAGTLNAAVAATPEPTSLALLSTGLLSGAMAIRRKRSIA